MEEKTELNDIVLNKGAPSSNNRKIILAIATLGVILIIVVMLMSTLTPDAKDNLPQPIPLPAQQEVTSDQPQEETLFEEVEVIQESPKANDDLDKIAQRLKQESIQNKKVAPVKKQIKKVAKIKKAKVVKKPKKVAPKEEIVSTKTFFIQVGSFSKYKPNKKFIDSILNLGYKYRYKKVGKLNKVLVGPFYTEKETRSALITIRSKIEAGAFLVKQ